MSINNIPSMNRKEIGYRTTTNSKDINDYNNSVFYDIMNLFNKTNEIQDNINNISDILSIDNSYLQSIIQSINSKLINNTSNTINKYAADMYIDSSDINQANISNITNDINIPCRITESKLSEYDIVLNKTFIPINLQTEITPAADNVNIIDTDIINAFNDDINSYYIRKVTTDNTVNSVTCSIVITLPNNTISTRNVNEIVLNPFPTLSVNISAIEYMINNNWTLIPSFNETINNVVNDHNTVFNDNKNVNNYNNCPNIKFNFKDTPMAQIRITLTQSNYIDLGNNKRLFCLGIKHLKVNYNDYDKTNAVFYCDIDLTNYPNKAVDSVQTILNNYNEFSTNVIQYQYYYTDDSNIKHLINQQPPFICPTNKLTIQTTILKENTIPNVHKQIINMQS